MLLFNLLILSNQVNAMESNIQSQSEYKIGEKCANYIVAHVETTTNQLELFKLIIDDYIHSIKHICYIVYTILNTAEHGFISYDENDIYDFRLGIVSLPSMEHHFSKFNLDDVRNNSFIKNKFESILRGMEICQTLKDDTKITISGEECIKNMSNAIVKIYKDIINRALKLPTINPKIRKKINDINQQSISKFSDIDCNLLLNAVSEIICFNVQDGSIGAEVFRNYIDSIISKTAGIPLVYKKALEAADLVLKDPQIIDVFIKCFKQEDKKQ